MSIRFVKISLAAAGASILLVGAGCAERATIPPTENNVSEKIPAINAPTSQPPASDQTTTKPVATSEVKEFSVTAKQWSFSPAEIRVKKGERVRLRITSVDVAHGFGLPSFKISEYLEPGKTIVVEFAADKVGTFLFFCNVYCGEGHGSMRGQVVVE